MLSEGVVVIEGFAITSIHNDIQTMCSHMERFIAAEEAGDEPNVLAEVAKVSLWRRKIEDSFDQIRNATETKDEGLPWGQICNASVQFASMTRQFSGDALGFPAVAECRDFLPLLRSFMPDRFREIMELEAQAAQQSAP